jgi:hypothetical protein
MDKRFCGINQKHGKNEYVKWEHALLSTAGTEEAGIDMDPCLVDATSERKQDALQRAQN